VNSENDFLREEPPAYGVAFRPSPILTYLRKVEAAHTQGNGDCQIDALGDVLYALPPAEIKIVEGTVE
jgi:hypothetical protein